MPPFAHEKLTSRSLRVDRYIFRDRCAYRRLTGRSMLQLEEPNSLCLSKYS